LPILIGSFVATYIVKEKPLLVGSVLSIAMISVSFLNYLMTISFIGKPVQIPPINIKIFIQYVLYLPAGLAGAYCAALIYKRKRREEGPDGIKV